MAQPPPDYVPPPWLAWLRRNIWWVSGVLGILTITAIRPLLRRIPEPPAVMFTLPADYALVDQHGAPFTPATLRGKVWVAGFVFTHCPSICPTVTKAMADLRGRFDRLGLEIEMVSFTVDPARDTPEVLAAYAVESGADNPRWRFVTGKPDDVVALVRHGFYLGVGPAKPTGVDNMYDISHSSQLALVDGEGNVRGFYGIEAEQGLDEIFHRAQHVLAEQARKASE